MDKKQYISWIKNIADIPDTMSVTSEIEKYPYCMLFHLIRSMKTDKKEDKTMLAILHPSRSILKTMLLKKNTANIVNDAKIAKTAPIANTVKTAPVENTATVANDSKTDKKAVKDSDEEKINIINNAAAEFRNKEDLMDILQKRLTELNPTKEKEEINAEESLYEPQPSVSLDELIEKFNKFPPKISYNPEDFEDEQQYKDLGKSSVYERSNIVSETLAELYCKQGAYDKAVKIYEALRAKYPEKSDTFAKIIENINEKR